MHNSIKRLTPQDNRTISYPSLLLVMAIGITSIVGIFTDDFYVRESINWQLQSGGQDITNLLLIIPLLVVSVVSIRLNKIVASLVWAGTVLYTFYTYSIYCFAVHFNILFPLYCLILCISIYTLLYFLYNYLQQDVSKKALAHYPFRATGVYFIIVSVTFAILWLSDILPAILSNSTPADLALINLPTNPVHVLDLSFFLPGIFLTGIALLRKAQIGYRLAPIILIFFVLMDLTIALLAVILKTQGQDGSFVVAGLMIALSIVSLGFFLSGLKTIPYETSK